MHVQYETAFAGRALRVLALLLPFIWACENATEPPVPSAVEIVEGGEQSAEAGSLSPVTPSVRVLDQRGRPMPGVDVSFVVTAGGGAVANPTATTDARGEAGAGGWTLGGRAGLNTLRASAHGLPAVTFTASGSPGSPAAIDAIEGDEQSEVVGAELAAPLVALVSDAHGNPVPGVVVVFATADGGAVTSALATTDTEGMVSTRWSLGTRSGTQAATASIDGVPAATFHAVAIADAAASIEVVSGDGQTAAVATPVAMAPTIRVVDRFGNAVSGMEIEFTVVSGAGVVDGAQGSGPAASVDTDSTGIARLARWILGTRAGPNTLRASFGSIAASFEAVGRASDPGMLQKNEGDGQTAAAGDLVAMPPTVRVVDVYDNPVPDATVIFSVTGGGGTVSLGSATTDATGIASSGGWRLGAAAGANTLSAEVAGLSTVTFTATATPATGGTGGGTGSGGTGGSGSGGTGGGGSGGAGGGSYDLEVRFSGALTTSQQMAFYEAAGRWARVIAGDLPNVNVSIPANACGVTHAALTGTVDDLIILVNVEPIDGPGNVLGSAGPCYVRSAGGLPVVGAMRLDAADVAFLETNGRLMDVVAHEIGHIIGIGTRWGSWLIGSGSSDPHFTGPVALGEFVGAGGGTYPGSPVPVENSGGPGTRDGHWRESIFQTELMTGWLDMGSNPLSTVSIGSLQDIGYNVDMSGAEGFTVTISAAALDALGNRPRMEIRETPLTIVPIAVDARGRRVPLSGVTR